MKKILIFITLAVIAANSRSQSPIDKVFDMYSGTEGFTTVYITKYMFDMFRDMDKGEGDKEMSEVINGLNSIKILATDDDPNTKTNIDLYKEVMKVLPKSEYKELMVIKEKDEDVLFLIREKDNKVTELLMIVGGPDEDAIISIQGDIDMKNISKIAKSLDIEGMDKLEKIE
jgi:hypothetical protein